MLREYAGTARATALAGGISAAAMSITVADGTGYPTGAAPFVITINAGGASEEKVLCASRTGNTISVTTRGWDDTTASDHESGETVQHTFSATDAREANEHVNDTTGDPHPQYLTAAEGNALFLTQAEGDALYGVGSAGTATIDVTAAPYNATGDGTTDDTAAVQAALDVAGMKSIYFPTGTYMVNNLEITTSDTILFGPAKIKKNGNGPMLSITASRVKIRDIWWDGNGGTYTGVGIEFPSAGLGGDFKFDGIITNTQSYCIDISGAAAASRAVISGSLITEGALSYAVRLPASEMNGDRVLSNIQCAGGKLVELRGAQTTLIHGCDTNDGSGGGSGVLFSSDSKKVSLVNNRLALAMLTVSGIDHSIMGNICAGGITLDATTIGCVVMGNVTTTGGAVDSGASNAVGYNP